MNLTEDQINRYSRQIVLKEVGGIGQEKLLSSRVTIIGLGALGSPVAYYLAAAGIGNLRIVDFDIVEPSNLHRQILHFTKDINRNKTESAYEKLQALNPNCNIEVINERIIPGNVKDIIRGHMFYANPTSQIEAIIFHDADVLDFMGAIGVARLLSIVGLDDWTPDLKSAIELIQRFSQELPGKLHTTQAQQMGKIRRAEMEAFLTALSNETRNFNVL